MRSRLITLLLSLSGCVLLALGVPWPTALPTDRAGGLPRPVPGRQPVRVNRPACQRRLGRGGAARRPGSLRRGLRRDRRVGRPVGATGCEFRSPIEPRLPAPPPAGTRRSRRPPERTATDDLTLAWPGPRLAGRRRAGGG